MIDTRRLLNIRTGNVNVKEEIHPCTLLQALREALEDLVDKLMHDRYLLASELSVCYKDLDSAAAVLIGPLVSSRRLCDSCYHADAGRGCETDRNAWLAAFELDFVSESLGLRPYRAPFPQSALSCVPG